MRTDIEERACDLALYIVENQGTVRSAAKKFGISKSTVHKDLSQRLPGFNRSLYLQVKDVLGCVVFMADAGKVTVGEDEYKLAQTIAGFLGRHMES